MSQKWKLLVGLAAFALLLAGAALTYNVLRDRADPGLILANQPGQITPPPETVSPGGTESPDSSPDTGPSETERVPMTAPDFSAEDSDGAFVRLSDFFGKPIVLNFWASWCPPCKGEMPDFDTVYSELGGDITFLMVNMTDGQRETKEKGAAYIADQGFTFPVYYDTTGEAAYLYSIRSIPTTLFLDSQGAIITGAEGQLDEATLRYGISLIVD